MATKLKAIIPSGAVAQRACRDDGQKLIRKSVRPSRRPKFSIRTKKSPHKKSKKANKADHIPSSSPPTCDAFELADPASGETGKKSNKSKKKRISLKMVRRAGQRIEWLLKKGAKYFGIAIIKIFNQPGLYTEESRTCVC